MDPNIKPRLDPEKAKRYTAQQILISSILCPGCGQRPQLKDSPDQALVSCGCNRVTIQKDRDDLPEPAVPYAFRIWARMSIDAFGKLENKLFKRDRGGPHEAN
jgi:hypothetical protein